MLLAQTLLMHILSLSDYCISLLARIQYIKFFFIQLLIEDGNLQVCACTKMSLRSTQDTL